MLSGYHFPFFDVLAVHLKALSHLSFKKLLIFSVNTPLLG